MATLSPRPVVLIVTYGFPPYIRSLGGAIRMLKLADYLQMSGCEVHVVCARTDPIDTFGYDALLARLQVHYVDDPFARRASRSFAPGVAPASAAPAGAMARAAARLKGALKALLLELLTPDTGVTAAPAMLRAVRAVVARHPDLTLISSGPPHSAHLIARAAKRDAPGIQWIVDYRDSWNGTSLFRKRMALTQWLNRRFERQVLAECDHLTFVSKPILRHAHARDAAALAAKATLVMNGFDAEVLAHLGTHRPAPGPARIGYFGAISNGPNSYRDPSVLLEVLAGAPELALVLELYGAVDIRGDWQQRLGARLVLGGPLGHAEAIAKMGQMDALMLLHTREDGAEEVVTGKVFEYIASGRTIISVGPAQMAVNELLRGDPSAHCVDHADRAGLLAVLSAVAAHKADASAPARSTAVIDRFTREFQYQKMLELITAHASQKGMPA